VSAARDALADGRLADALALQANADDPAGRLFRVELLALAGRLHEAFADLHAISSADPTWPAARRGFADTLRAEHRRSHRPRPPRFLRPPPPHARRRRAGLAALHAHDPDAAADFFDRAAHRTPPFAGHLDGAEFDGLRDADDRFAAVLEAFIGRSYLWVPFDHLRRVTLRPAAGVLDAAFRPADLTLADGRRLAAVLPLLYPGSHAAGDDFALGRGTDWANRGAVTCGVGARVWWVGDEEVPLAAVRQLDLAG
jgi:type VI secretion system protein ImpE